MIEIALDHLGWCGNEACVLSAMSTCDENQLPDLEHSHVTGSTSTTADTTAHILGALSASP
jgi:hypothetical protein